MIKLKQVSSIIIDIQDVTKLFRFIKNIHLNTDQFLDYVKKLVPYSIGQCWYNPTLYPRFAILPSHRCAFVSPILVKEAGIQMEPKPRLENLSRFNIFEIVPDEDEESLIRNICMDFWIEYFKQAGETKVSTISLRIAYASLDLGFSGFSAHIEPDSNADIIEFEDSFKTFIEKKGRRIPIGKRSKIHKKIMMVENGIIAILNFLYTLRSGEYFKDEKSEIFEPIAEQLRSYGSSFDDLIATIRELMTIIG